MRTFVAFVDAEKVFRSVYWNKILRGIKEIGEIYYEKGSIHALYREQMAVIKCGDKKEEARIKIGVRQGRLLSPLILDVYIEKAINKVKE